MIRSKRRKNSTTKIGFGIEQKKKKQNSNAFSHMLLDNCYCGMFL